MPNRTDITRWMTEYDEKLTPGYWHFPYTTRDGIEPAVNMGTSLGRHSITFTDPTSATREVAGGPLVPGPRAGAYGKCSVIAANPVHGTWGEIQRNKAAGAEISASVGDELVIFGYVFRIDRAPNRNISLALVDDSEGLTADEMRVIQVMTREEIATTEAAYAIVTAARALRPAAAAAGLGRAEGETGGSPSAARGRADEPAQIVAGSGRPGLTPLPDDCNIVPIRETN
jgi:hypothetical protein